MHLQHVERNPDLPLSVRGCARSASDGWLLAGLIVVISAVILALAGITFFLTEHLRVTSLRQNQTKAIYLAQAGVMQAIFDFRFDDPLVLGTDNCFTLAEYPVPSDTGAPGTADDDVFILGGKAADFLMANMIPAILDRGNPPGGGGQRDRLRNWSVQNVLCSAGLAVRIDWMTVTWANALSTEGVTRIEIPSGTKVWPPVGNTSFQNSGQPININDTIVSPNTALTGVIWFSTNNVITNASSKLPIDVAFQMSDHNVPSSTPANWSLRIGRYDAPSALANRSGSFTIKSVGEVRKGSFPFVTWRRLQMEYRLNDDDTSTNRQEVGNITADPAPSASRPGYSEINWKTP